MIHREILKIRLKDNGDHIFEVIAWGINFYPNKNELDQVGHDPKDERVVFTGSLTDCHTFAILISQKGERYELWAGEKIELLYSEPIFQDQQHYNMVNIVKEIIKNLKKD